MEDLNKQQLILLVLLVSFVTSIATGIITASLLEKAPVAVTQTVNRVVERTVETVVPEDLEPQERTVTVRETVVVSEEDRVVDAISENRPHIVRIFKGETFVAIGFIRDEEGEVVTVFDEYNSSATYRARLDGEDVPLAFVQNEEQQGVSYFKLEPEESREFPAASVSVDDVQLGQTLVAITGSDSNAIATGRVAEVESGVRIVTDMNMTNFQVGTVLINLSGGVVGMYDGTEQFIPAKKFITAQASESDDSGSAENTASAGQAVQ